MYVNLQGGCQADFFLEFSYILSPVITWKTALMEKQSQNFLLLLIATVSIQVSYLYLVPN